MNVEHKKPKAIALLSGGLDSTLAISIMLDLGVEVVALNFTTIFCNCTSERRKVGCGNEARRVSKLFGVELKVLNAMPEYMEVVKNPKFGRGSGMNACRDCRIFMFKKAKIYMEESGGDFIVTGEVLGQRPMSQHKESIRLIERESGLEGLVVRPLCAKLLPASKPETDGLIDRERLLAISGRSRKPQIQLAAEKGITDYACPAGGCLLADKSFSKRLRDLLDHDPEADVPEVKLLKYGRHFRLSNGAKVIVGRDEAENDILERLARGYGKYQVESERGAMTLAPAGLEEETKRVVASIAARYSQQKEEPALSVRCAEDGREELMEVEPATEEDLAGWRIG